jgi:hypothetical protein
VYNKSRSEIFLTAYDPGQCGPVCENATAIHGLRHTYGEGRVLYFAQVRPRSHPHPTTCGTRSHSMCHSAMRLCAQGHDMAEYEEPDTFEGNHAFATIIERSLLWLAKRAL